MADNNDKPVVFLKEKCPFCMKVRIAILEAGLTDKVEVRDFAPGDDREKAIRAELEPKLEKVSFPAAKIDGEYMLDSDPIVARIAGADAASKPVLKAYLEGPFQTLMTLFKENRELKAAAGG